MRHVFWFFTFTLKLIFVSFLSQVTFPTIKFISTIARECFASVLDSFIPLIILNTSGFTSSIRNTYSTKWILDSITDPTTTVHTNDECYSSWRSNSLSISLVMHSCLFMDIHFIVNDPSKPNKNCTSTISVCLMNPGIYTILCFFIKYLWIFSISQTSFVS